MPLLPYEKFELCSPLSPGESLATLAESTEPRKLVRFFARSRRPFEGEVIGDTFEIRRIIGYGNSFLPQISGSVGPNVNGGSRIAIRMRLHPFTFVFMCVWFGGVIMANVVFPVAIALDRGHFHGSPWAALIAPGMLLFGWLLVSGSFSFESRKATALLSDLLRASKATLEDSRRA